MIGFFPRHEVTVGRDEHFQKSLVDCASIRGAGRVHGITDHGLHLGHRRLGSVLGGHNCQMKRETESDPQGAAPLAPGGEPDQSAAMGAKNPLAGTAREVTFSEGLNAPMEMSSAIGQIAFLGDYSPRKCGIATFTTDLCESIAREFPK